MTSDTQDPVARIADEIERGFRGDPWHGSSTQEILAGIDSETAARRPIPGAHTIGEIVAHLAAWTHEIARRVAGAEPGSPPEGDWPPAAGPTAADWEAARADLNRAHAELVTALRQFPAGRLGQRMGSSRNQAVGTGLSFEQTLHGVSQHLAYHTGQIALLCKQFK
jgi:uncharacterized damage-inducible protein DinB